MVCLNCRDTGWGVVNTGHRTKDGLGRQVADGYCGCVAGQRLEYRDRMEAQAAPRKKTSSELIDEADDAWAARNG